MNPTNSELDSLESLLEESLAQKRVRSTHPARDPRATAPSTYSDPLNWLSDGHVALVHRETLDLLGHFEAFHHRTVAGCRKLVRVSEVVPAPAQVEFISVPQEPVVNLGTWRKVEITTQVSLPEIGVTMPLARLLVWISEGHLSRVDLQRTSVFRGPGQFLRLPAGLNILPLMNESERKTLLEKVQ